MLSKADILKSVDVSCEAVVVPEWGVTLCVKVMSGTERDSFEASVIGDDHKVKADNLRAKLLVRCLCDEEGKRLFDDADATALGGKSAIVLDRLFTIAQRVNALDKRDIEELEKN